MTDRPPERHIPRTKTLMVPYRLRQVAPRLVDPRPPGLMQAGTIRGFGPDPPHAVGALLNRDPREQGLDAGQGTRRSRAGEVGRGPPQILLLRLTLTLPAGKLRQELRARFRRPDDGQLDDLWDSILSQPDQVSDIEFPGRRKACAVPLDNKRVDVEQVERGHETEGDCGTGGSESSKPPAQLKHQEHDKRDRHPQDADVRVRA